MASTIAALTAGGGGVATTADSSGNLDLKSGTTTVLALTATGVAVTGTLTSSGVLSATSPTFVTPVIDSATVATVSGTAPLYMCRAWVNFNGTGTVAIRASGNVSSITDNGVGDYTMNFTTAMTDINYSVVGTAGVVGSALMGSWLTANRDQTSGAAVASTTSAVRIGALTSAPASAVDCPNTYAAVFR